MTAGLTARLIAQFSGTDCRARLNAGPPLDLRGPLCAGGRQPLYFLRNNSAGILDGDNYDVSIAARDCANVRIASPASTKVFAMRSGASCRLRLDATSGAFLTWGVHSIILQRDADFVQETSIALDGGVVLFAEVLVLGRLAAGEFGAYRRLRNHLQVAGSNGTVLYEERCDIRPSDSALVDALGGMGVLASFYALGLLEAKDMCGRLTESVVESDFGGFSLLPNDAGVVGRFLAGSLSQGLSFCENSLSLAASLRPSTD